MIRFIDLTRDYFASGPPFQPVCAFISTSDDRFISNDHSHLFSDLEDIDYIKDTETRSRCRGLIPPGFFERDDKYYIDLNEKEAK